MSESNFGLERHDAIKGTLGRGGIRVGWGRCFKTSSHRNFLLGLFILEIARATHLDIPGFTEALVASALQKRSDVRSHQHAVQATDIRVKLAQANLVPDIALSGSYSHTGTGTGGFVQPPDNTLGASVSVNLPFSRWGIKVN